MQLIWILPVTLSFQGDFKNISSQGIKNVRKYKKSPYNKKKKN